MLKVELCIILIMMLIDTRAVIHATIAANKDWYKLILISEPVSYTHLTLPTSDLV